LKEQILSLSDYDLFARIVAAGSLSAAARTLSLSPAQVSKRLAALEHRLGVQLVHRTTRRLTLTAAGERFHVDITKALHAIEEAENRLGGIRDEPSGPLRVSAPTSFGRLHIAPHLHRFVEDHPRVELEFDLSDGKVDLFGGYYHLAVRITSDIPASLAAHRLGQNRRILCASPSYLDRHGTPHRIEDLSDHTLLAADGQLPWRLESDQGRRTIEGHSTVRTNSSEIVRELALGGGGIAFRSLWDVHDDLRAGRLLPILPDWGAPADLGIYAVHPKAAAVSAATAAFVAFLDTVIDPQPWEIANQGLMQPCIN
jgi:DNA-binding transcriptional LysR family regulator